MQKGFGLIGILIVVAVIAAGAVWYVRPWEVSTGGNNGNEFTACTQEAMQCPDGSYVSRTGLNCAFAECPTLEVGQDDGKAEQTDIVDTTGWKTYRNEEYGFEVKYPNDWSTTEKKLSNDHPDSDLKVRISISNSPDIENQKLSKENMDTISGFSVTFRGSQNQPQLDIEKWYEVSPEGDDEIISKMVTSVAGRKAVCVESSWREFIVQRCFVSIGTSIIEIGYSPSQLKFIQDYENILSTFKFIP